LRWSSRYDRSVPRTRPELMDRRGFAAREVGRRLAAGRERAGLSQAAAATALGIPKSQIGKLELGIRQLLFLEGLRLAALYAMRPEELDPDSDDPVIL
jgi:transcriptional regulator with XRE-family HTH domain